MRALRGKKRHKLRTKLVRVFLMQVALISVLVIGGVYAANAIVKGVLIRHALEGEASYFWTHYAEDHNRPLPDTHNLTGFLSLPNQPHQGVPDTLHNLSPGMHRVSFHQQHPMVYVSDKFQRRLYLVFDEKSVTKLAFLFGLLPLMLVLIVLYLLAWIAYRQSSKAVSPVVKLAEQVNAIAVSPSGWASLDIDSLDSSGNVEVHSLSTAIQDLIQRLQAFIERERAFSRDASHELRTPIAALKGALEVLEKRHPDLEDPAIARMHRNILNMQDITETLLLLARSQDQQLATSRLDIQALVETEMDALGDEPVTKPITLQVIARSSLTVEAPQQVVAILIGNLLKNAYRYTSQGRIEAVIHHDSLDIIDTGVGMDQNEMQAVMRPFYRSNTTSAAGHGLGLSIVQQLCQRYGWRLSLSSSQGEGTRVKVHFFDSSV